MQCVMDVGGHLVGMMFLLSLLTALFTHQHCSGDLLDPFCWLCNCEFDYVDLVLTMFDYV